MSLPGKSQQIAAVSKFIDSDFTEGKSVEEVAKAIVDGFHDAILKGLKKPATPLREGMLFKMPTDGKVRRVQWLQGHRVWVTSETDSYGWLGSTYNPVWALCEEFQPKAYRDVDGKRKLAEMTEGEIALAWSNPDWKVGDRVSIAQREHAFEVIATSPGSVLMSNIRTDGITANSTAIMNKYYRREVGVIEW